MKISTRRFNWRPSVPIGENIDMGAMAVVQFWYRIERDTN